MEVENNAKAKERILGYKHMALGVYQMLEVWVWGMIRKWACSCLCVRMEGLFTLYIRPMVYFREY